MEFALVSIVLFMILFGTIEFGREYSKYQVLQGAAREGARLAAVRAPTGEVVARVYDAARPYAPSSAPGVTGACTGGDTIGRAVRVGWTQRLDLNIAFVPLPAFNVDIEAVFRCE